MYYIFNRDNKCIGKVSSEPNMDDLSSRDELAIESSDDHTITSITLLDGEITFNEEQEQDISSSLTEHLWVQSELKRVDIQLMYHWTEDTSRASLTEKDWKDYAISLRDYTTVIDGEILVNSETRPTRPEVQEVV